MKVKTSELTGRALNYAVAVAELGNPKKSYATSDLSAEYGKLLSYNWGANFVLSRTGVSGFGEFNPSKNWYHGGYLIEKHSISLEWEVTFWSAHIAGDFVQNGDMPLIAACRCIVAKKFGDEVEIPKELIGE